MGQNLKHLLVGTIALSGLASVSVWAASSSGNSEPGEAIISQFTATGVAPPRGTSPRGIEAEGPFDRLVIKNATLIDGTGAPPQSGVNITIEKDRIIAIDHVGGTRSAGDTELAPQAGTQVIDAEGQFVLPGFIDAHTHLGNPLHLYGGQFTDSDYVFKLYLAHGVTSVRDTGSLMGLNWLVRQKTASEASQISAPRIFAYALFPETLADEQNIKSWVQTVKDKGADGVKFLGASPKGFEFAMNEIKKQGLGSAFHHAQISVTRLNALDTSALGLDSLEHWYGIPEAMFSKKTIQNYPLDYDYNDEQDRFREAGNLWQQTAEPGSDIWNTTIGQLVEDGLTLSPTFSVYEASRDLVRAQTSEWHDDYTMPYMTRMFTANPRIHGSFFFDWTTKDEVAWRENYRLWMAFVNDFKNAGGRVVTGSDSGFIYSVYGFGFVRELEMFQEAGFHPLEIIQSATLNGAELLGVDDELGSVEIGKKADLIIVNENPLANFKVLYATGHSIYDFKRGKLTRTKGIRYTIKDGVIYDADILRQQVRSLVSDQKAAESKTSQSP